MESHGTCPNILILHADQLRYDCLGFTGGPKTVTPHIDHLAGDSLVFDRHISANPVCSPSRACLLTGMTVPGHGLLCNGMSLWRPGESITQDNRNRYRAAENREMPDKIPTIADLCRKQGYETAAFGKIHLQSHLARTFHDPVEAYSLWEQDDRMQAWEGPYYGFDRVRLIMGHGEHACHAMGGHYAAWLQKNHPGIQKRVLSKEKRKGQSPTLPHIYLSSLPSQYHHSMWLADEFARFLKERHQDRRGSPFLAFIGFPDPHLPYTPPEDVAAAWLDADLPNFAGFDPVTSQKPSPVTEVYRRRHQSAEDIALAYRYTLASIHLLDRAVGRIMEALKSEKQYDNTIIVFTSDHGDYLGDYSCLTKSILTSMSLNHIPLVIKAAADGLADSSMDYQGNGQTASQVNGQTASQVAPQRICRATANYDVLPTLLTLAGIEVPEHVQGKPMTGSNPNLPPVFASGYENDWHDNNFSLVDDRWRYTFFPASGEEELYDHQSDPGEEYNLAREPSMLSKCREYRQTTGSLHMKYDQAMWGRLSLW